MTLTNSGGPKITITQADLAGSGFTLSGLVYPVTLSGGQSAACSLTFAPTSAGAASGSFSIKFSASNNGKKNYGTSPVSAIIVPVAGTGVSAGLLVASTASIAFGNLQVGNSQTVTETLTNSGTTNVNIAGASATGTGFSTTGPTLPLSLAAGQSVAFNVAFAPASSASYNGNLTFTSDASNSTLNVPLSGTGVTVGAVAANPTSLSFGSIATGSNSTLGATLTNVGGSTLTISQIAASGAGFSFTGINPPVTLTAGGKVNFSVVFAPQSGGSVTGGLVINSNGSNPTLSIPLTGTGTQTGQLAVAPATINFGSVQMGNSQTVTETLTNTGGASVTISAATVSGSAFSENGPALPLTLTTGQSVNFSATFSPSSSGSLNGNLAITSNASNPTLNVPLSGIGVTAGAVAANPTSLSFGSIATGSTSTLGATLTNVGGSTLTISQMATSGAGFSLYGINPPVVLTAGQKVTFSLTFAPQSGGDVTGNLAINSNGSNPTLSVPLTGSGIAAGQLAVSPTNINFGNVVVGASQSQSATLTATNGPVTVSTATVNESEFSITGTALPVTIPAGYSLSFSVRFAPTTSGPASANVTFASNASNSSTLQSVSGSGTPPPQHNVALSWNASTSSSVVGYNIYRGTVSGGPYTQVNSALDSTTSDTDSAVQAGQTYYYVVTAVDSTGVESGYSNQTTAVIPTP